MIIPCAVGVMAARSLHHEAKSGLCELAMLHQMSRKSPCIHNVTFGCESGRRTAFWVRRGCRGEFACANNHVWCGDWRNRESSCACEKVLKRSPELPRARIRRQPPSEISLLVAIVASSRLMTQERTLKNMQAVDRTHADHRARVDWAVVAYDDQAGAWAPAREKARALRTVGLVCVVNASSGRSRPLIVGQRKARLAHQLFLLRVVWNLKGESAYSAVWLPDDDLAFDEFDLTEYLWRWHCLFPAGPPVISQPPLRPSKLPAKARKGVWAKLDKSFLNDGATYTNCVVGELAGRFGRERCFLRDALALRTAWVEGQAALLDARFLLWFSMQPLVQKIALLQLHLEVETGPDAIWCGAAAEWAAEQSRGVSRGTAAGVQLVREACALLTVPIGHDDTRSLVARTASHVEAGFVLLFRARIRRPLRDSLGETPRCYRHNCSMHRWFRYSPSPNWALPTDETGLRQIHACVVRRELGGGQCHRGRHAHGEEEVTTSTMRLELRHELRAQEAARRASSCDGMHQLYWSTHEY